MNIHCTQKIGKPISFMNKQLKKKTLNGHFILKPILSIIKGVQVIT